MRSLLLGLAASLVLLSSANPPGLSNDPSRVAPLAEPFDYPANVANGDVAMGARLVSRKEVRKAFKDRLFPNSRLQHLSRDFTVVEVGFYPSEKRPVAVDLSCFRLVSAQGRTFAVKPEDAVFELIHGRPRDSPIRLAKKKKSERSNLYEDAMRAALFLRGLPTEPMSGPRGGYLYFSAKHKNWKGAESLIVEYISGKQPIKLIVPVSH